MRASQVAVGTLLDLQGDPYADPTGTDEGLRYAYAEVRNRFEYTHDEITVVHLDTSAGTFAFPADHDVLTHEEVLALDNTFRQAGRKAYRTGRVRAPIMDHAVRMTLGLCVKTGSHEVCVTPERPAGVPVNRHVTKMILSAWLIGFDEAADDAGDTTAGTIMREA